MRHERKYCSNNESGSRAFCPRKATAMVKEELDVAYVASDVAYQKMSVVGGAVSG